MTREAAVKVLAEADLLLLTAWRIPEMRRALLTLLPGLEVGDLAGYRTGQVLDGLLRAPDPAGRVPMLYSTYKGGGP